MCECEVGIERDSDAVFGDRVAELFLAAECRTQVVVDDGVTGQQPSRDAQFPLRFDVLVLVSHKGRAPRSL